MNFRRRFYYGAYLSAGDYVRGRFSVSLLRQLLSRRGVVIASDAWIQKIAEHEQRGDGRQRQRFTCDTPALK